MWGAKPRLTAPQAQLPQENTFKLRHDVHT